jgi:methyl-accepting chemotaxis protein
MSSVRNLSLSVRLAAGFGLACLAIVVVVLVGTNALGAVDQKSDELGDGAAMLAAFGDFAAATATADAETARHLYTYDGDLKKQDEVAESIERDHAVAAKALARVIKLNKDDADELREVEAVRGGYEEAVDRAVEASREETVSGAENRDGSRNEYLTVALPARQKLDELVADLSTEIKGDVNENLEAVDATKASSRTMLFIAGALGLLAALAFALLIARSVTRPVALVLERLADLRDTAVTDLGEGLRAVADGDLTRDVAITTPRIDDDARDELGRVSQAVDAIRDTIDASVGAYNDSRAGIDEIVRSVVASSASLSTASQQMASTSEEAGRAVNEIASAVSDVAQGAERQVRSVEEAKHATEAVGSASQTSARTALETAEVAADARRVARDGQDAVSRATSAMHEMRDSSAQVSRAMQQLGTKSDQIGGIVETITGIAGQTNLLALNAAIEAARAGEQGRGFAVVAEEVRKLAEESQEAAATISSLVEEIQHETSGAISIVEETTSRTDESAATVEAAHDAFTRIGEAVEDMTGRIDAIAAAVQDISESAQRVQNDMSDVAAIAEQSSASTEQVSASTQETSASAQEIASSAQELAATAERLEELVARFRLVGSA